MINVIRSNRKTVSIAINSDLSITVRAPMYATEKDIDRILKEKAGWIQKHIDELKKKQAEREAQHEKTLTKEDIRELAARAVEVIPERVRFYAKRVGVNYGRITVRNQRTCWGSCSAKGNLNFNCLLMLTPPEVLDYVVVHELCHRKEMNHSAAFWSEVQRVLPDYRNQLKWLKTEGGRIMRRMTEG